MANARIKKESYYYKPAKTQHRAMPGDLAASVDKNFLASQNR
jgi:hypothetical protein